MRLDQFLKASRLVSRRTLAQELCDAGVVSVNGVVAKSSRPVRVGDEIMLRRRERVVVARVLAVPTLRQVSKDQAATLCEILKDEVQPLI